MTIRPFAPEDFPIVAQGHNVYRATESGPICTCADMAMANQIAYFLNAGFAATIPAQRRPELSRELLAMIHDMLVNTPKGPFTPQAGPMRFTRDV